MNTSPAVLFICIVTILNVDDFPAPLAPSSPKISLFDVRSKEMPFTALMFPEYVLVRFLVCKYFDLSVGSKFLAASYGFSAA